MPDLIAFCQQDDDGEGQVNTIAPSGTSLTALTSDDTKDYAWCDWSPDGTKLLACSTAGPSLLILNGSDGSIITNLTNTDDLSNAHLTKGCWTPDGLKVYAAGAQNPDDQHVSIQLIHADNSGFTILPATHCQRGVQNAAIRLSPDGTRLAYPVFTSQSTAPEPGNPIESTQTSVSSPVDITFTANVPVGDFLSIVIGDAGATAGDILASGDLTLTDSQSNVYALTAGTTGGSTPNIIQFGALITTALSGTGITPDTLTITWTGSPTTWPSFFVVATAFTPYTTGHKDNSDAESVTSGPVTATVTPTTVPELTIAYACSATTITNDAIGHGWTFFFASALGDPNQVVGAYKVQDALAAQDYTVFSSGAISATQAFYQTDLAPVSLALNNAAGKAEVVAIAGDPLSDTFMIPVDWYADSKTLLVVGKDNGSSQLWKFDTGGGSHGLLYDDPGTDIVAYYSVLTLGPDQTQVAGLDADGTDLIVVESPTSVDTIYTPGDSSMSDMVGLSWFRFIPPPPPVTVVQAGPPLTGIVRMGLNLD